MAEQGLSGIRIVFNTANTCIGVSISDTSNNTVASSTNNCLNLSGSTDDHYASGGAIEPTYVYRLILTNSAWIFDTANGQLLPPVVTSSKAPWGIRNVGYYDATGSTAVSPYVSSSVTLTLQSLHAAP